MAYLRTKWINGYPYLYRQESYREHGKVKTRTVEYLGSGYRAGSGLSGGAASGTTDSRAAVDKQLAGLQHLQAYPFEAGILQGYLYRHDAPLRIATAAECVVDGVAMGETFYESLLANHAETNGGYILLPNASPFTWLHTLGHLLQDKGNVATARVATEVKAFISAAQTLFSEAGQGSLAKAKAFIATYGDYIDMRQRFSVNDRADSTDDLLYDKAEISQLLQQAEDGTLAPDSFIQTFQAWVVPNYHFDTREVVANALAALAIDAKYAADCFGKEGKTLLTVMYPVLHVAMEEFQYVVTGRRPYKKRRNRRTRRHSSTPNRTQRRQPKEGKILFNLGELIIDDEARNVLYKAENNQIENVFGQLMVRHTTVSWMQGANKRQTWFEAISSNQQPIESVYRLNDSSVIKISTHEGATHVTILQDS